MNGNDIYQPGRLIVQHVLNGRWNLIQPLPQPPDPMPIQPFKLERYFARYEFSVKYLLSSSDFESLELLGMAAPCGTA